MMYTDPYQSFLVIHSLPMSIMPADPDGITNLVLLQHMQGMRSAIETRLDRMDKRMNGMDQRFDGLAYQMTEGFRKVNDALQRLYTHRVKMLGRIEHLEEVVGVAQ